MSSISHKLFGHGWIGRHIVEPVAKEIEKQGFYVGYKAEGDGTNGEADVKVGPVGYNTSDGIYYAPTTTQRTNYGVQQNLASYSRTAAATASDIAQGGMTKKEVQDFNMRHPNETALRG